MKLEVPPMSAAADIPQRRWKKPVIAVAVVIAAGAGVFVMQGGNKPAPAQAAVAPKQPVFELSDRDVLTVAAREMQLALPLSGALVPLSQATVKSKVSGVVLDASVREGMQVTAGQVIARLDTADHRARVAQQQAALDEANAKLSLAKKNNANSLALLKQHYISQSSYDATQNSVDLAQAAVDAARAQLELARISLNDAQIRAPLTGVVSKRHVQAGEKLAPDMPVFTIVDLRELSLEAQVPASDIPRVEPGQEVRFTVDGFGERSFSGKVARINPTTEPGSRAMLVYVSVSNPDGALRGGMFAKGKIITDTTEPHPAVPLAALRQEQGRDVVYRIDNGVVVSQPVQVGIRNEDEGMVEVLDGLAPGSTVLAAKLDGVKPGSKVKLPAAPKKG